VVGLVRVKVSVRVRAGMRVRVKGCAGTWDTWSAGGLVGGCKGDLAASESDVLAHRTALHARTHARPGVCDECDEGKRHGGISLLEQ